MSIDALLVAPSKQAAPREASRVLRPGGRLVLTTWDYSRQPEGRPRKSPTTGRSLTLGLAYERRACLPGPRRGVAQKRRERQRAPFWNWACPPRSPPCRVRGKEHVDGGSDDRGRSARGLAHRG